MLVKGTLIAARHFFLLCEKVCIQPFHVDRKTGEVKLMTSKWRLRFFIVVTIFGFLDILYLMGVLVYLYKNCCEDFAQSAIIGVHAITRSVGNFLSIIIFINMKPFVDFYRKTIEQDQHFQRILSPIPKEGLDPMLKALWIILIFGFLHSFAPAIDYLGDRHSIRYWVALVTPKEIYDSVPGIFLNAIFQWWFSIYCNSGCALCTLLFVLYFHSTGFWLSSLTKCSRTIFLRVKIVPQLNILNNCCNSSFSGLWGCIQLIIFIAHLAVNVSLVKVGGVVSNVHFIAMIGGQLFIYWFEKTVMASSSQIFENSNLLIHSFKNCAMNKATKKKIFSWKPLRVKVASFYYMSSMTPLLFMHVVLNWTVSFIIS